MLNLVRLLVLSDVLRANLEVATVAPEGVLVEPVLLFSPVKNPLVTSA